MPSYVYRCGVCGSSDVEVTHPMTVDPDVLCDCGLARFRVPQPAGMVLRGGGWVGRKSPAQVGVEGKVPPPRPVELGGTGAYGGAA
jgi:predicted nucleic acid-binding Zn ribbon protein